MSKYLLITGLLGRLGERQLYSATVGVVPLAHSTFVLLFVRTDLLVAAYMLCGERGRTGNQIKITLCLAFTQTDITPLG